MLRLGRERDQLRVVDDQYGAPTTSMEVAKATHAIVHGALSGNFGEPEQWSGLYHMTCSGATTWYGFARRIFERAGSLLNGKQPHVIGVPSNEYPTAAKRPHHSVLSNALLEERFGIRLSSWEAALDHVLCQLKTMVDNGA